MSAFARFVARVGRAFARLALQRELRQARKAEFLAQLVGVGVSNRDG